MRPQSRTRLLTVGGRFGRHSRSDYHKVGPQVKEYCPDEDQKVGEESHQPLTSYPSSEPEPAQTVEDDAGGGTHGQMIIFARTLDWREPQIGTLEQSGRETEARAEHQQERRRFVGLDSCAQAFIACSAARPRRCVDQQRTLTARALGGNDRFVEAGDDLNQVERLAPA